MSKITIGALLAALIPPTSVFAHSWYPSGCCSGQGCHPVPCAELAETAHGWRHVPTGINFTKEMERPTQDKDCHVCVGVYVGEDGKPSYTPRCVFIQPNS